MSIQGEALNVVVDREVGQSTELAQDVVVACIPRREAGFEKEREASRDLARFQSIGDLVPTFSR
jgi:hypothetical protein